ncbi:MAG: thioredoxin family protein [Spirochaetota bacterium]
MTVKKCKTISPLLFLALLLSAGIGCGGEKAAAGNENSAAESAAVNTGQSNAFASEGLKVTFVELGSVNCVPCRMMQPVIEKVKKTYPGQVKVLFYDVWTEGGQSAGAKYNVQSIPTQVFLDKSGKEYFRHVGFFPFEEIDKVLKQQGVR